MQPSTWTARAWPLWVAAALSAALLELPFPIAGPMPPWRSIFAWFGLVPLLWALGSVANSSRPRPLRLAFLLSYFCGVLWYLGNCYWIRDTMMHYGDMPPLAPELLLLGYSLVLGLYFGLFGLAVAVVRQTTGSVRFALAFAPIAWAGLELAASRITSVPWDQLGYSQVDNLLLNQLAPWTGVYGISFVLVLVNALIACGLLTEHWMHKRLMAGLGVGLALFITAGIFVPAPRPATTATAMLVQPNLDVAGNNNWGSAAWDQHMAQFHQLVDEDCKSYMDGIPQTGAPTVATACSPTPGHPALVAWPESPAPFIQGDQKLQQALRSLAIAEHSPLVVGGIGTDYSTEEHGWHDYNSAIITDSAGQFAGRYDKIHLVPFGEYIPFQQYLTFAHKLTGKVSSFSRGEEHKVFLLDGHRYGVFICYEAVFADEVRHFAANGAEVLVNISDDGWYGDTSAPWQHFNEARMRAIENRRWILRDTNTGVTAVIDPDGVVRQSIPRHQVDVLPARFGYRSDVTFYSAHGDVFGWLCVLLGVGFVFACVEFEPQLKRHFQVSS